MESKKDESLAKKKDKRTNILIYKLEHSHKCLLLLFFDCTGTLTFLRHLLEHQNQIYNDASSYLRLKVSKCVKTQELYRPPN